jgi:Lrp/AsnC family transcriptional regulator, leucine-responsive regulatory protein
MRINIHSQASEAIKLDKKDRSIIALLSDNSRLSYAQISRKVRLSKDSVKYRMRRLEEKGIVQGYIPIVDTNRLGFLTAHLFIQLSYVDEETRKALVQSLAKEDFIKVIIHFSGVYDFEIGIAASSISQLDKSIALVNGLCAGKIKREDILIFTGGALVSRSMPAEPVYKGTKKHEGRVKIDKTDLEIIACLSQDARSPLYAISQKVGLSADAIRYRLRRIEAQGLITKYVPVINYSNMGYSIHAVLMNLDTVGKEIHHFLSAYNEVIWAVRTIGSHNLLIYICVDKPDKLHSFLNSFRQRFSHQLRGYETVLAYEEYVYNYFPPILQETILKGP